MCWPDFLWLLLLCITLVFCECGSSKWHSDHSLALQSPSLDAVYSCEQVINFIVAKNGILIEFKRVAVECQVALLFGSLQLLQEVVSSYVIFYLLFIPVLKSIKDH
jgi:hypothetical protein